MCDKTIKDVREFWDRNPLLTGEIKFEPGTRKWFSTFDEIKTADVFMGDMRHWIYPDLIGKKILDVGCGPGYWSRQLGKINCEYHGVDISPRSVELAKESQRIFGLKGLIREGNAEQLDYPDKFFDHVLSEGVIHHTPDTQKCINEIYRVLKNGGTATVSVYYKNILLKSKILFKISTFLMRLLNVGLKGRGRERMCFVKTPEDIVRCYDGMDNPIGKAYSKKELRNMFSRFSYIKFSLYYIPSRAFSFRIPHFLLKLMTRSAGLMILVEAKK